MADKIEAAKAVIGREKTQAGVAAELGVSRQAVHQWVQLYRLGELHEGRPRRGRPKIRNLTEAEGERVKQILVSQTPEQVGIDSKFNRWDYEATKRLIQRETGVKMTYRIVAEHMDRWEIPHGPNVPGWGDGSGLHTRTAKGGRGPAPGGPSRKRGRPRKQAPPEAGSTGSTGSDQSEEVIDYEAELAKSRDLLRSPEMPTARGRHARQRQSPFTPKKKRKK